MVRLKEIAKKVGVSCSTVSRAINNKSVVNEETKKTILKVAKELNYRPNYLAKGLALNKKDIIDIMFLNIKENPSTKLFTNYYEKEKKVLENIKEKNIKGFIFIPIEKSVETTTIDNFIKEMQKILPSNSILFSVIKE